VKPEDARSERSGGPAPEDTVAHPARANLWEQFLSRGNLAQALRRVEQNAGGAGIDGMSTQELRPWLHRHWPQIRSALEAGTYRPQPVRRVMIPKPSGGRRTLGVPTAVDRLICQALSQVLTPAFDPHFSDWSFGFRPGRSAHQAVLAARRHIAAGQEWVCDIDLDAFFDRVQHDALMARVARRVRDKRVLGLLRRYLESGVMADGLVHASEEGTPQGSPLSPLLSNVMLDDLDSELERRGHRFVRYADDAMLYVSSERAGQRVMGSITRYIEQRLKLKVNRQKSAVAWAGSRSFLGFSFWLRNGKWQLGVDRKAPKRAKQRLRQLTARGWGVSMNGRLHAINRFVAGWTGYFSWPTGSARSRTSTSGYAGGCGRCVGRSGSAPKPGGATCERSASPSTRPANGPGRAREAGASQAPHHSSAPSQMPTGLARVLSASPIPTVVSGLAKRTAGCGPARPVVWGRRGEPGAYPIKDTRYARALCPAYVLACQRAPLRSSW
jgi:RNA-directed DNA polymerase